VANTSLRRLSWAGIEAIDRPWRLLVDPLENVSPLRGFLGAPRAPLVPITIDQHTWVLVTHLHPDHCDRQLVARVEPGQTICHAPVATKLTAEGLTVVPVELWQAGQIGPFSVTAVPSHDWRGDDQVAWIIESDEIRLIHCGDTIWHGNWYEIARRRAPFHAAFLPINGVIVQLDGFTPTDVPATLTPEQAVEAAVILGAGRACAIHHSLFQNPPSYVEQPDAIGRFLSAGKARGISAIAPRDGEAIF
jgi:L-ascorbate metabolism protein UlaG (beta-lactamase superfamily)